MKQRKWYKVLLHPNVLTALRIVTLVPILLAVEYEADWRWPFGLFVFGSLLDIFDGYLARRWQLQTAIGKVLDPIADKVLLVILMWLMIDNLRPHPVTSMVVGLMVAVEILLLVVRMPIIVARYPWVAIANPAANGFGKVKVWVQSFVVGALLYDDMLWVAAEIGVYVATAFAILSAVTKHPRVIKHPMVEAVLTRRLFRKVNWRFAAG